MRISVLGRVAKPAVVESAYPLLKPGLTWIEVRAGGSHMLKDLRTGLRAEVGDAERTLCGLLDGRRSTAEIAVEAARLLRRPVSEAAVRQFVRTLSRIGALEASPSDGPGAAREPRRVVLTFHELDGFFAWLARHLRWCFSPYVQVPVAAAALTATTQIPGCVSRLSIASLDQISFTAWVFLIGAVALSLLGHELAHGVTLRHFGGRVGDVRICALDSLTGITVDVTDIYRLPTRWHAALVFGAGPYVDLIGAAAAVAAGGLAPASFRPWFDLVACIQCLRTALGLVPFHESDGYYLAALAVDVPKLQTVSSHLLRLLFRGPRSELRAELAGRSRLRTCLYVGFAVCILAWRVALAGFTGGAAWLMIRSLKLGH
jgi:putative peptide zinc metalloprotease protein